MNCWVPNEKMYVNLKGAVSVSLAPRPRTQASHGQVVLMQGIPAASQASETGLIVSGVDVVSIMSIASELMSSCATSAPRCGLL